MQQDLEHDMGMLQPLHCTKQQCGLLGLKKVAELVQKLTAVGCNEGDLVTVATLLRAFPALLI